ncbi:MULTISPECIES: hypothetical protein [unclassified Beijerinckia]|uniref:thermonuclease family protein n=1 Tax=unclassified Beijerinckia TaxID=2638183 RepID=UPI00089B5ABE|nr:MULTISPECIES: hypothetical protein [unclassified Beijerinckia]MDH7797500.1 endonuclease YncB(thermonuclease family) [Beijerinckia sp. GAS462]SEC88073.1 Endonuclease YncB, thermonuclease family [Beijerinckia sp. 28-YEA-48]
MGRIWRSVVMFLACISMASAACGERGGPGYRGPDGRCVSWKTIAAVCGHPPETRCTAEQEADGAREVGGLQHQARQTRRPEDRANAARGAALGLMGAGATLAAEAATVADNEAASIDPETIRVLDGDTIEVGAERKRVRLIGFNAPETNGATCERERDLGLQASRRLSSLIASEPAELQLVPCACRAGTEGTQACNYGRACGILKVDGVDVSKTLIRERLAVPFVCGKTRCPPTPRPWCS